MSAILDIIERIQETEARIKDFERAVAENPNTPSLILSLRSFEKMQKRLEAEFEEVAAGEELELVKYRVFDAENESVRPPVAAVTQVMTAFQEAFTLVYDALKANAQKFSGKVGQASKDESAFRFAYSFSGSVGFALTIEDKRALIDKTDIERALDTLIHVAQSHNTADIQEYAQKLGPGPIRAVYRWAGDHVEYGTGVDLSWARDNTPRGKLFVQPEELVALRDAISRVSDKNVTSMSITAALVGIDVKANSFHLETLTGEQIKGKLSDVVAGRVASNPVSVPREYKVSLSETTVTSYATEDEKITYLLTGLEEAG